MKNTIIILLVFILFSSCKTQKNNYASNLKQTWMLTELSSFKKDYIIDKKASISFLENNLASAYMGCNQIGLEYKTNGKEIKCKPTYTTRRFCEDMSLESKFISSIEKIKEFKIIGQKLYLYLNNGEKIVFATKAWD